MGPQEEEGTGGYRGSWMVIDQSRGKTGPLEGKQDKTEYLSDLLGQAVCTALEDLDDLLVV